MNHAAEALALSIEDRATLEQWVDVHSTSQQIALRAQIILYAAEGMANSHIVEALGVSRPTVLQWRERFAFEGVDALIRIKAGRGRKPQITREKIESIIHDALHVKPEGATHWSCRTMTKHHGVGATAILKIWEAYGLQPHRIKTLKLPNDPQFIEKFTDVVGMYMNPPDKAEVICVDEKTQIQALDRTQPGLPMKKGRCGARSPPKGGFFHAD